ncbi:hypothetical protein M885DRAFT_623370 [Pelagophyceae sp. CCMP2097]|nr:hypothetical protein M885DRAFT_623370 [Pelagophyceae sp. CCMP2097]
MPGSVVRSNSLGPLLYRTCAELGLVRAAAAECGVCFVSVFGLFCEAPAVLVHCVEAQSRSTSLLVLRARDISRLCEGSDDAGAALLQSWIAYDSALDHRKRRLSRQEWNVASRLLVSKLQLDVVGGGSAGAAVVAPALLPAAASDDGDGDSLQSLLESLGEDEPLETFCAHAYDKICATLPGALQHGQTYGQTKYDRLRADALSAATGTSDSADDASDDEPAADRGPRIAAPGASAASLDLPHFCVAEYAGLRSGLLSGFGEGFDGESEDGAPARLRRLGARRLRSPAAAPSPAVALPLLRADDVEARLDHLAAALAEKLAAAAARRDIYHQ